jgi:outer membrane protein assembly factor BamA
MQRCFIYKLLLLILFFPLLFVFQNTPAFGADLDNYSENYRILLTEINISGNKLLSENQIQSIMNIRSKKEYLIREISIAIDSLKKSGYFASVKYILSQENRGFIIDLTLSENPPISSIKLIEDKMLDMTVFHSKLNKFAVITDKVFSKAQLDKAIEEFISYSQNNGIFLYSIKYRNMTLDEIKKENASILFEKEELDKPGMHLVIIIEKIKRMTIAKIRMKGFTCGYSEILNYLMLKEGDQIKSDKDLFFRYKRLKRLGFFESVIFRFEFLEEDKYKLIIDCKEVSLSDINTSITAPPNIGLIFYAEYFNIGILNTLQRIKIGAGWEGIIRSPIFILEYTNPYFWKGLFIDATVTKNDQVDPIKDQLNYKYSQYYEDKTTVGFNIYRNLFSYLIHSEQYVISRTVDHQYKELPGYEVNKYFLHSTGILLVYDDLDDNFFITRGFKISGKYDTYWKNPIAYKGQVSGELYLPVPFFDIVMALTTRENFLFTEKNDTVTTLTLDSKMRTNVQEISDINNQQIKFTSYSSTELRFPMPDLFENLDALSFVVFAEAGGAWADYSLVSLQQTRFGVGIGLRLSPRRHYSSFIFQFPAGLYLGYRFGDTKTRASLISHRDELYYINLSASF